MVELDYSGLHINMLYAMGKLPMPEGDVYHIDGYSNDETFRKFVKRLLQAMINASNRNEARAGIQESVHRKKDLQLPPEIASTKGKDLYPIMDAFERKHDPIKKYFCSGKGIDLQYLDSQMAERVLLQFTDWGYAILPMHDSFIIHHGLESDLNEAMEKAFFDMFGAEINVDLKYNSLEERKKKRPPRLPAKEWTPEYIEGMVDNSTIEDIIAWQKPYSVYWKLLEEHHRLHDPKGPEIPPDDFDLEFSDIPKD